MESSRETSLHLGLTIFGFWHQISTHSNAARYSDLDVFALNVVSSQVKSFYFVIPEMNWMLLLNHKLLQTVFVNVHQNKSKTFSKSYCGRHLWTKHICLAIILMWKLLDHTGNRQPHNIFVFVLQYPFCAFEVKRHARVTATPQVWSSVKREGLPASRYK